MTKSAGLARKITIEPAGFFVLRSPIFPFDVLARWTSELSAAKTLADGGDLDQAVLGDRAVLTARLREHVLDPVTREAIFVASPSLDSAIDAWLASPEDPRAHGVVDVIVRYISRMTARATPFGLFSGCAVGSVGGKGTVKTQLALAPLAACRRHTRLDIRYLSAVCDALGADPGLRARLRFKPSNGLYETPAETRCADGRTDPKTCARSYSLVSVERSGHLDAALARARGGATCREIAQAIVDFDAEIAIEEASALVNSLVESQILASDVSPVVTGREPIDDLLTTLRQHDAPAVAPLSSAAAAIRALDAYGVGRPPAEYRAVAHTLEALPVEVDIARLFHVDLYKPVVAATLGKSVIREFVKTAELLARITPRDQAEPLRESLRRFREAFQVRYEGSEVPLMDALDEETGIGFSSGLTSSLEPSPLLEGLRIPGDDTPPRVPFGLRERHMERRVAEKRAKGCLVWELDAADLEALSQKQPAAFPDSFAVRAVLAAASCEAIDRGDFQLHWHDTIGASGAQSFGRFCHGDAELRAHVVRYLRAEEAKQPDAAFAEVVHLPDGQTGNILCRPVLRAYEISYLGRSGAALDQQIAVSDLLLSVLGDRIVLRSKKLGCEIVPRMTTAHKASTATLGAYRFLYALRAQEPGSQSLGWNWGPLADSPFTPRVTHGKAVLARARWVLPASELKGADKLAPGARFRRLQELRQKYLWPRWIAVADADNVLPLDLDNTLHADALANFAKNERFIRLVEVAPTADELVVGGPEGHYMHELVVPFVTSSPPRRSRAVKPDAPCDGAPSAPPPPVAPVTRKFAPASEWLYAKLYTGTPAADGVLVKIVAPLVAEARASGAIDRWFFIRYGDPDWHVRVRFHGEPGRLLRDVLPRLHELARPWINKGRVWKMQIDTYDREIERYGGNAGMELCERLFEADSDAVVAIIARFEANDTRWRLAFRGIHLLLRDLGLDLAARVTLMHRMRETYALEQKADAALEIDIGNRFRLERPALEALVSSPVGSDHPLEKSFAIFAKRSTKQVQIAQALVARQREGALTSTIAELAGSFVHMHANRILRSDVRLHELVLCDFLARLYESEIARTKPRGEKS